jgi:anti-anti-sigma factor
MAEHSFVVEESLLLASPLLQVHVVPERSYVRVVPVGEIDLSTCEAFRTTLDELWSVGWTDVVVDLRQTTFIDSTGMHVLIHAHRHAAASEVSFTFIDGAEPVSQALRVVGIDQVVPQAAAARAVDGAPRAR